MLTTKLALTTATLLIATGATASAQQAHVAGPEAVTQILVDHADAQDANRAAVHAALARPEVRAVASQLGLDLKRADEVTDTLSGADLERAANAARQVNGSLVGGASTIVISTTAIIVALLIILIIVAAT
jgi:hypothetical protein